MNFIKGLWKGQKLFGEVIAGLINFVLLSIVYILGVGGTAIVAKISKKRFLDINLDKSKKTYWQELNLGKKEKEDYYKQF